MFLSWLLITLCVCQTTVLVKVVDCTGAFIYEPTLFPTTDREVVGLLPKIELHAHLHGSIRIGTLQEISIAKNIEFDFNDKYDIDHCFRLFALVHKCVSSLDILTRIFNEVIDDYMKENTIYLELRSTPRALEDDGSTKSDYVKHLARLVMQHNSKLGHQMLVKLILSIDRSRAFNDSLDILPMAVDPEFITNGTEYPVRTMVGIDFSGNPYGGRFSDFAPIFEQARAEYGLAVTIHTAELKELSEAPEDLESSEQLELDETSRILQFNPERIGHALFLQQRHLDTLELRNSKEYKGKGAHAPAIEICPTSNLLTLGLKSHAERPYIDYLRDIDYPISINTDDRGIFNTTLTEELLHVMHAIKLDLADLVELQAAAIEQSFSTVNEKVQLREHFWGDIKTILVEHAETELIRKTRPVDKQKLLIDMTYLLNI